MSNIIEFPDIKKLQEEIKELKEDLNDKFFERDVLKFNICENIKMEYMLSIGNLELKLYELYTEYLRLRRKRDIIQAYINRQEKIDIEDVEQELDNEFIEYQKKLEDKIKDMNDALDRSNLETLPPESADEIKKKYKKIVKMLHPDLNPNISETDKMLFINAVESYKDGNLENIRIIYEIIEGKDIELETSNSLNKLKSEKNKLLGLLTEIDQEIDEIKNSYPYILKEYLDNKEKKENLIAEIMENISDYQEAIDALQERIKELLEN